jgi:type IV pilus assembly protein PilC
MPLFRYQAKDIYGKTQEGTIEAGGLVSAADKLRQQQLFITHLQQERIVVRKTTSGRDSKPNRRKVSSGDLIIICRQLGALLQAGVAILQALDVLALQNNNRQLKDTLRQVIAKLKAGYALSTAMQGFPHVFPKLLVSMVEAGEYSGRLDSVLFNIADYMEQQQQIKTKVKTALLYPTIICITALLMVLFILVFVLPRYVGMLQAFGLELPLITQILITISNFIQQFWLGILFSLWSFIYILFRLKGTTTCKAKLELLLLRIPLMGPLVQNLLVLRFTRTLAVLLQSGVPLLSALKLSEKVVNNASLVQGLVEAQGVLQQGGSLTETLRKNNILPPAVLQLLTIGEQTGQLATLLDRAATVTEQDIKASIDRLSPVLEPVLLILASVFVGVMVIAVMLPVFRGLGTITGY